MSKVDDTFCWLSVLIETPASFLMNYFLKEQIVKVWLN